MACYERRLTHLIHRLCLQDSLSMTYGNLGRIRHRPLTCLSTGTVVEWLFVDHAGKVTPSTAGERR